VRHRIPGQSPGRPLERLLQTIASGALGTPAFKGGKKTAAAGMCFHFIIAFAAATVYFLFSQRLAILIVHPFFSGILYGVAVHLIMSRIVVPLSNAPRREFSAKAFLIQLLIHIVFVGLPIALTVSRLTR
jgi:hypothetical protein